VDITASAKWVFVASAVYVAVTLPVVFIPNPSDGSLMPIRLSQPIAAIAALLASMLFLWRTRSGPLDLWRCLAMGVAMCRIVWLATLTYLIASLDTSGMENM
jgi:hypothetical protein